MTGAVRVSNIGGIVKRHSKTASVRQIAGTQAVVRALRILRAFTDARPEWSLADLSRELGLSKPTAFRLLLALEHEGLVVRPEIAGPYRLGPAAIELGARAQRAQQRRQRGPARSSRPSPAPPARPPASRCSPATRR